VHEDARDELYVPRRQLEQFFAFTELKVPASQPEHVVAPKATPV
jgi:hypothetical protein